MGVSLDQAAAESQARSRARGILTGLEAVGVHVRAAGGLRRFAIALAAGGLLVLAVAPFYAVPVLFVSFPVLVWLIDGAGPGWRGIVRAFVAGWAFGFGFLIAGLYWVGHAFLVDADTFGWMVPFVVVLFPGGLALFPALASGLARAVWPQGFGRILVFAAFWSASEWLRGHVLSGFPWNLVAHAWGGVLHMMQTVAWFGVYGLSLVTVLAAACLAELGFSANRKLGTRNRLSVALGAFLGLGVLFASGAARLATSPTIVDETVRIRIVHAAIPQRLIADWRQSSAIFSRYLALTAQPGLETVTHVIWPEAALPFDLTSDDNARAALDAVFRDDIVLLTGGTRVEPREPAGPTDVFNSLHVIAGTGALIASYDKFHLVPFGEYLPAQGLLERWGLMKLTGGLGSFARGPGPRTLGVPGARPVGALICYEIIFPAAVVDPAWRPGWLVNVTDDSWFGAGSGPRQHFAQARFRAIEEGLPVIRAANRGISAVIDANGRVLARSGLGESGIIDSALPNARPPTFYARLGDRPFGVVTLGLVVLGLSLRLFRAPSHERNS